MNWLLVGVIFVLVFCTLKGYQKGFIRVLFSLASFFLVIGFVTWATPYISSFLETNTKVFTTIQSNCQSQLETSAQNAITEQTQAGTNSLKTAGIVLPSTLQEQLIGNSANAADQLLESSGLYTQIADTLAHFIVRGISFFLSFVIAVILLKVITGVLDLMSHLPVIHGINKTAGLIAGLIQGLFYVWLYLYFVAVCCTSSFGMLMVRYIDQSVFLTYLYNNNGLLQFLGNFFT